MERKSVTRLKRFRRQGLYHCYGGFENDQMVVFAFCFVMKRHVLLDYYAVCGDRKGQGYGGKAIELLKEQLKDKPILLESECEHTSSDPQISKRRLKFYFAHNFQPTNVQVFLKGETFNVLSTKKLPKAKTKQMLQEIYQLMFTETEHRCGHVKIFD